MSNEMKELRETSFKASGARKVWEIVLSGTVVSMLIYLLKGLFK
jgi:hypothetical protein